MPPEIDFSPKYSQEFFSILIQFIKHLRISRFPPLQIMCVAAEMRDLHNSNALLKNAVTDNTSAACLQFRSDIAVCWNPEIGGVLIQSWIEDLTVYF